MKGLVEINDVNFDPSFVLKYLDRLIELQKDTDVDMSEYIYLACDLIHSGLCLEISEVDVECEDRRASSKPFIPFERRVDK